MSGWLTALKVIHWADVIEAAPGLAKSAKGFFKRTQEGVPPAAHATPPSPTGGGDGESLAQATQRITIAAGQGAPSPATIMFISPLLDKDTRNARVIALVDNIDRKWRPGAFVTAEIPVDQSAAALVVPKAALQTLERDNVVFVRTDEGFEARKVKLGRQDNRVAEITDGLKPGERIATANTFVLKADLGKAAVEHQH
eukprot:gene7632-biopygen6477